MARPASRFIEKLTSRQIQKLTERKDHGETPRIRHRAHAILLSFQGTSVVDLAQIFQTNRTTVSQWLDRWDAERFAGLADKPRPGAPARFSESERTRVLELLKQFPQNPAAVLAGLKQETGNRNGNEPFDTQADCPESRIDVEADVKIAGRQTGPKKIWNTSVN